MVDRNLDGIGVLITRPERQAAPLCDAIERCGGVAIRFPVFEIVAHDPEKIRQHASAQPDISIFVSPNAVKHGLDFVAGESIAAIGPATAAAIEEAGLSIDILSDGYDSEALLDTQALQQVAGKSIRIIRGNEGRELLASTLRARGADVTYLEVYERRTPTIAQSALERLEQRWRSGGINIVTVMSVGALQNLIALLPEWCREALQSTPLVTPARRVIKEAEQRFPSMPTKIAKGPQTPDMLDAILACNEALSGQNS